MQEYVQPLIAIVAFVAICVGILYYVTKDENHKESSVDTGADEVKVAPTPTPSYKPKEDPYKENTEIQKVHKSVWSRWRVTRKDGTQFTKVGHLPNKMLKSWKSYHEIK